MTCTERPTELTTWKNACSVLLEAGDSLPAPLESELQAFATRLDYALNNGAWQTQRLTDDEALEAIAALLLIDPDTSGVQESLQEILRRTGR